MSVEYPFITEAKKLFDPDLVDQAQRQAINRIKNKVATAVSRSVRKRFNITATRIAQDLKLRTTDQGGLRSASLTYAGTRIGLVNYSASFRKVRTTGRRGKFAGRKIRRTGATARVTKGAKRFLAPGGFIAKGASGNIQVFQRIEKNVSKSKLRKMTGPAVPQMVSQEEVIHEFRLTVDREFPKEFESKLNYLAGKIGL